jgi:hypothetical protein
MAEQQAESQVETAKPQEGTQGQEPAVEPKIEADKPKLTPAEMEAQLKEVRAEAAKRRKENADLAAKVKEHEDAKLSETEKTTKRVGELESANQALTLRVKELTAQNIAAEHGALYPEAVARLREMDALEFDDNGVATNIDAVMAPVKAKFAQMFRATQTPTGNGDGGARQPLTREVQPGLDRLTQAYAASSSKK